jgi:hypothetical protein
LVSWSSGAQRVRKRPEIAFGRGETPGVPESAELPDGGLEIEGLQML